MAKANDYLGRDEDELKWCLDLLSRILDLLEHFTSKRDGSSNRHLKYEVNENRESNAELPGKLEKSTGKNELVEKSDAIKKPRFTQREVVLAIVLAIICAPFGEPILTMMKLVGLSIWEAIQSVIFPILGILRLLTSLMV